MFEIIKKSKKSNARLGELKTLHGGIETPFFMPIATKGAVKNLSPKELKELGAQIVLSNTFHLFLNPGIKILEKSGGLHNFMKWNSPILTDSGGFQVFSLAKLRKISNKGVIFRSPIDGKETELTPEKSLLIQKAIGSDIMMVLDECPGYSFSKKQIEKAVKRTFLWAEKSKKFFNKKWCGGRRPLLFGIVQGGIYKDLRQKSLNELSSLDFDGCAVGGLAVGEPSSKMFEILDFLKNKLPQSKPRYLMGVGYPEQIIKAVKLGIDMFDCVIPTRHARHGEIFVFKNKNGLAKKTFYQTLKIANKKFANDLSALDKNCSCYACRNFSRAYLHLLYRTKEPLYSRLATIHNLKFYLDLMKKIRTDIKNGRV